MNFRQILLMAVALCVVVALVPAGANLTISHEVFPDEIWSLESGQMPNKATVNLNVEGESVLKKAPIEVVLAIDCSASMKESDPENKRLDAAKKFVGKLDPAKDKVGLVSWNERVDFSSPLTNNFMALNESISRIEEESGTNLDEGLKTSIDLLEKGNGEAQFIIFLSDGDGDYTPSGKDGSQVDRAKKAGIRIYSIGLKVVGDAADNLKDMTAATGGEYYDAPESGSLESIYSEINSEVTMIPTKNIKVRYEIPKGLTAGRYSINPGSERARGDLKWLTWNVGTIPIGENWSVTFEVCSQKVDLFHLGGYGSEVTYTRYNGTLGSDEIENKSLDVVELRSGASVDVDLDVDFQALYEKVNALHDVVEHDDSHAIWRYTDKTGDFAFVFSDGKIAVASTDEFDLNTWDNLTEELSDTIYRILVVGGNISGSSLTCHVCSAAYYGQTEGIYHRITHTFDEDFDLNLVVPDCDIKEARLMVEGEEYDYFGGAALQEYYINGEYAAGCEYHHFPWTDGCTVNNTDITDKLTPGTHVNISSREIAEPHTMVIDVITTSKPPKDFLLYSDDLKSVWIKAVTNSLTSIKTDSTFELPRR